MRAHANVIESYKVGLLVRAEQRVWFQPVVDLDVTVKRKKSLKEMLARA